MFPRQQTHSAAVVWQFRAISTRAFQIDIERCSVRLGQKKSYGDRGFSTLQVADDGPWKKCFGASGRPADDRPLKSQAQHAEDVLDRRAAGAADRTSGPCGGRYIPTFVCQHMFFGCIDRGVVALRQGQSD